IRQSLPTGDGYIYWLDHGWIDEDRNQVIIVSAKTSKGTRFLRRVNLETCAVSSGDYRDILRVLSQVQVPALSEALDLAKELGLKEAKELLPRILDDGRLPLMIRLKAAVFLAALGDNRGRQLLVKTTMLASRD